MIWTAIILISCFGEDLTNSMPWENNSIDQPTVTANSVAHLCLNCGTNLGNHVPNFCPECGRAQARPKEVDAKTAMQVTTKIQIEINRGQSLQMNAISKLNVDAYMSLRATIANDGKWHKLRLDAGDKENLRIFMIQSSAYVVEGLPSGGGLFMEFTNNDSAPVVNAIKMEGPHLYMGPGLDLLPQKIESVRLKNNLTQPVTIDFLIGKVAIEEVVAGPQP